MNDIQIDVTRHKNDANSGHNEIQPKLQLWLRWKADGVFGVP